MDQADYRLPLRVIPRWRGQIGRIAAALALIFGCAVVMAIELQKRRLGGMAYVPGSNGHLVQWGPYIVGIPVILFGLWRIAQAIAKLLPGSPYYYLRIAADGLEVASLFATNRLPWSKLGAFSVYERTRSGRYGRQVDYIVIASHSDRPKLAMDGRRYELAAIRINPDEYGSKSGQEDSEELAAWFNRLRLASLTADSSVDVPSAFRDNVMPDVTTGKLGLKVARPSTVVRR